MSSLLDHIDPVKLWVGWVFLILATGAAFIFAFRYWRRARLIEDAPTAKIQSAPQGYVELEGEGQPMDGEPIISYLSKIPCIWYQYEIARKEEADYRQAQFSQWRVIEKGTSDNMFWLIDDTGRCAVDAEGAEVTTSESLVWYGDMPHPVSAPLIGSGKVGSGVNSQYRYSENLMLPGQMLYAIGEFRTQRAIDGFSVAELTRDILRDWKQDRKRLLDNFDITADGEINPSEWDRAREAAQREAEEEFRRRSREPDIHVLRKPGTDRKPYLLSVFPQHQLTRRYRKRAALALGMFFVGGIVAVWFLQNRLG
jgi:hypothetical protein